MSTYMQTLAGTLDRRVEAALGFPGDPIERVEARAAELLSDQQSMVWEADATTFAFSYVSLGAESVLGYPAARWTAEPTFWADVVLHHADRDESVAYCLAETAAGRDHTFEYRARAIDRRVVRLRDYVRVITDDAGRPRTLRGIMVEIPSSRRF